MQFNKNNVNLWMRNNCENFRDRQTGEICATIMAESCAEFFDKKDVGGPLDDECHWIWEVAVDVSTEME